MDLHTKWFLTEKSLGDCSEMLIMSYFVYWSQQCKNLKFGVLFISQFINRNYRVLMSVCVCVSSWVCVCVCLSVCVHNNSKNNGWINLKLEPVMAKTAGPADQLGRN